jgi:hypothetical protein
MRVDSGWGLAPQLLAAGACNAGGWQRSRSRSSVGVRLLESRAVVEAHTGSTVLPALSGALCYP